MRSTIREALAQSSGLTLLTYVEPVRTPFPQITAAPNQLRRTSSTFHRDSALMPAIHARRVLPSSSSHIALFVDLLHNFTASPTYPLGNRSLILSVVRLVQCTHLHDHAAAPGISSLIAHEPFSTGGLWHMRRLTIVQRHTTQGGAWLTMSSPCSFPAYPADIPVIVSQVARAASTALKRCLPRTLRLA